MTYQPPQYDPHSRQDPPDQPKQSRYTHATPPVIVEEAPFSVLISAAIFVWFGYISAFAYGEPWDLNEFSKAAVVWVARVAAIVMGAAAVLGFAKVPLSRWLNLVGSLVGGTVFAAAGALWLVTGYVFDGFLIGLLGLITLASARTAWSSIRLSQQLRNAR